ncbi:MAG TPA: hypothetical protein VNG53_00805 [Bacteroidia bacterium]|nr:hypothetical protein [Bacteroidia bacterium]
MKKLILFSSAILICLSTMSFKQSDDTCKINCNGIYAFKIDAKTSAILRFFDDGTVLASSSINDYTDVNTWFTKDNTKMVLSGKYKVKKCSFKFKVKGETGSQKYVGTIQENQLTVTVEDLNNKTFTTRIYSFIAS